jgi:hypothetical protein
VSIIVIHMSACIYTLYTIHYADNVVIFDEKFRVHTQLYPSKVTIIGRCLCYKTHPKYIHTHIHTYIHT